MRRKHILVVDDEPRNLRLIKEFLEGFGHSSELANDGLEALEKLKSGFDLVLLDVMMPGMDGFEVVRHMRENREFTDIPIILVTVLDDKKTRIRAIEAGVNDFISKPIDRLELSVRIESLLKMKDAQDAIKRHQAELEETVQERTAQLLQYNELLKVELADRKRAEAELLASEKKYRSLFEESTDGIFINKLDGALVDANRSFLDLFGYDREEIIGKTGVINCFDLHDKSGFRSEIETKGYARDYPLQLRKKERWNYDGLPCVRKCPPNRGWNFGWLSGHSQGRNCAQGTPKSASASPENGSDRNISRGDCP